MRVLSGVVCMIKSRGPRTEPWGTSQNTSVYAVIAFDTKTAKGKIVSKPVQSSAVNAKPRA